MKGEFYDRAPELLIAMPGVEARRLLAELHHALDIAHPANGWGAEYPHLAKLSTILEEAH